MKQPRWMLGFLSDRPQRIPTKYRAVYRRKGAQLAPGEGSESSVVGFQPLAHHRPGTQDGRRRAGGRAGDGPSIQAPIAQGLRARDPWRVLDLVR